MWRHKEYLTLIFSCSPRMPYARKHKHIYTYKPTSCLNSNTKLDYQPRKEMSAHSRILTILTPIPQDIRHARPNEWGDSVGGRSVVKACCGVRVLLHVLQSGARAHPGYVRLHHTLRELAARALHALACLHLTSRYVAKVLGSSSFEK